MTKKALKIKEDKSKILGKETIYYIWKKIKNFFPYVLVSFITTLFVINSGTSMTKSQNINSIWNLFLLDMSGIKCTIVLEQTWYISAMLISMMILYPIILKYKKNYTYLIAPLIVIFVGGWLSHNYQELRDPYRWNGMVCNGLLRGFFELALGGVLYEIIEKIKNITFTRLGRYILTLIETIGFASIFFIVNIEDASGKYSFIMLFIIAISTTIAFSEKTIFYNFLSNKLIYYLERLSLPIYLNHIWIMEVIRRNLRELIYIYKLGLTIICTIIFSIIIMYLIEKIKNNIDKPKSIVKRILINEN